MVASRGGGTEPVRMSVGVTYSISVKHHNAYRPKPIEGHEANINEAPSLNLSHLLSV